MTDAAGFAVNTYSYIFKGSAADTVARLADQGYGGVELMFFPGHLWPAELDGPALRSLRRFCETRLRLVAVNMPNVDMNIGAASAEMRAYTLDLLVQFVRCAGELGAGGIIVGPGKYNPLFPMPRDRMIQHFYRALDTLDRGSAKSTPCTRLRTSAQAPRPSCARPRRRAAVV